MRIRSRRVFAAIGSLLVSMVLLVVAPVALTVVSRLRFDDGNPLFGLIRSPRSASLISWVTGGSDPVRIDESIVDVLVAVGLMVGWAGIGIVVVSVALEVLLRLRHGGADGPARRGPSWSQRLVGYLATGVMVVVSQTGLVRAQEVAVSSAVGSVVTRATPAVVEQAFGTSVSRVQGTSAVASGEAVNSEQSWIIHRVGAGESILSIAQHYAGGREPLAVAYLILEANLGSTMPDGSVFSSPAVIEPGWELKTPVVSGQVDQVQAPRGVGGGSGIEAAAFIHVVQPGETLWDLADHHLGDPLRWPEIFEVNAGRVFADSRTFDHPNLIYPGWDLIIDGGSSVADPGTRPDAAAMGMAEPLATVPPTPESADREFSTIDSGSADSGVTVAESTEPEIIDSERIDEAVIGSVASGSSADESTWLDSARTESAIGEGAGVPGSVDRIQPQRDGEGAALRSVEGPAIRDLVGLGFVVAGAGGAAMLMGGLLTALVGRRRQEIRAVRGRRGIPVVDGDELERSAQVIASAAAISPPQLGIDSLTAEIPLLADNVVNPPVSFDDLMIRFDLALRALARVVTSRGAGVVMARIDPDGGLRMRLDRHATATADWQVDGQWWTLPASTGLERLTELAQGVAMPSLTMVQIGRERSGALVFVDLEMAGVLSVESDEPDRSDAVVAALGACLAGSDFSDGVAMATVGLDKSIVLGRRTGWDAESIQAAVTGADRSAREALSASAFSLRARASGGERWEPLVVLAGSRRVSESHFDDAPLPPDVALVVSGPYRHRGLVLRDAGSWWELSGSVLGDEHYQVETNLILADGIDALRIRFGSGESTLDAEAVDTDMSDGIDMSGDMSGDIDGVAADCTERVAVQRSSERSTVAEVVSGWRFMVRLLGPVDVVSRDGEVVRFERSRSVELLAWLVTHRRHATRMGARTAMWEIDVRNATFSNVVSDVRRGLARVGGDDEEGWIAYGTGDDLVLHPSVCSDAELLAAALEASQARPTTEVIEVLAPAVALVRALPFATERYLWPDSEGITTALIMTVISASTRLAEAYLELGDDAGVYRATEAGLGVIPGHEELIALRLRAHGRMGDQAGLRSEWEAYRRALERDPWADAEPSWRLVELRNELLGVEPTASTRDD